MIGYKLVIWTEMYSIMCITKYFKNSRLQTFHGRVTASWDSFFVFMSVFLNVCICVCVWMWRPDANLGCHSSGAIIPAFFDTGFPPWIWGSLVRLSCYLVNPGNCLPPSSNSGPKAAVTPLLTECCLGLLRYSLWQNDTLVFLFVRMFWGIASHTVT